MPRHIKFKAELVQPTLKVVKVTILEQTHFGRNFGNSGGGCIFSHGEVDIVSDSNSYYSPYSRMRVMLTSNPARATKQVFAMTPGPYEMFKQAVLAYNECFKDDDLPSVPGVPSGMFSFAWHNVPISGYTVPGSSWIIQ